MTLLADLLREYTAGEAFLSYFPEVVVAACPDPAKYAELFSNILMATKLTVPSQVTMALALYLYDQKELAEVGEAELERKLKELRALSKRGGELPERVLDEILFQISQNSALQERLQE